MTQNKEDLTVVFEEPDISKAIFIDFQTEREEWNKYRLADGTLVRAKFIISGFMMNERLDELAKRIKPNEKLKIKLGFKSKIFIAVEPPPKLRGPPDSKAYSKEELRASIIDNEIDFETVRATWNSYVLENGVLMKLRFSPISISRANKFDNSGMPRYLFDTAVDFKVSLPERIQKILRKRKTKTKKSKTRAD